MFGEVKCKKCGKVLDSVTLTYGGDWLCGECADNKESILFCERGSKVKAVKLDSGYKGDVEQAHKLLKQDAIYEVESIEIGGYLSSVRLKEFPNEKFNTVHFVRC